MSSWLKAFILVSAVVIFVYWIKNHSGFFPFSHNPIQYMPNMHRTDVVKAQRKAPFFEDQVGPRVPPTGTVARGIEYYEFKKEDVAGELPVRPNPVPITLENVKRGKLIYEQYCIVCHGPKGLGNGYVVPPYPKVPSLQSEKILGLADSQIFHVISVGQNTMGAYGDYVRTPDRWKLVHYIRALQKSQNPNEEDLEAFDNFEASAAGAVK